jgi:hypothetical protein
MIGEKLSQTPFSDEDFVDHNKVPAIGNDGASLADPNGFSGQLEPFAAQISVKDYGEGSVDPEFFIKGTGTVTSNDPLRPTIDEGE